MLTVGGLNAFYDESQVLFDIGLAVAAGARVAVMGRNGAGKSTLLKSIMGAGPRVTGHVLWDGADVTTASGHRRARAGIVMVPEDRRILAHLTVVENLQFAAIGAGRPAGRREAEAMLGRFAMLQGLGQRFGNQLSGGQQQMVAVARGLMARPRLLLLDEPTEGLAPIIVDRLAEAILAHCAETGTGLLLCEQNIAFARRCTERLYLIDAGAIVFQGDWSEFDADPAIKTRYLAV